MDTRGRPSDVFPTVVVPGFMKAGSTTIHSWLSAQPEFPDDGAKEPGFLARNATTTDDLGRYAAELGAGRSKTIDASVEYLDPINSATFAARLNALNPEVRIVIAFRDPIERAVSHIRHNIRRGRIRASSPEQFADLIRPGQPYFERSRYGVCVEPLVDLFDPSQIAVIPVESPDELKWEVICDHVGLSHRPLPQASRTNRTEDLHSYTPAMRVLVDRRILSRASLAPAWARRGAKRLLLRGTVPPMGTSQVRACLNPDVLGELETQLERFQRATSDCRWAPVPGPEHD